MHISRDSLPWLVPLLLSTATCGKGDEGGTDSSTDGTDEGGSGSATASGTSSGEGSGSASGTSATSGTTASTGTSATSTTSGSSGEETGGTSSSGEETGSSSTSEGGSEETGGVACPYTPVAGTPEFTLQEIASGLSRPVLALGHPDVPDRLYVVERDGQVRILEPGETTAPVDAFLELEVSGNQNNVGTEQGLLGFAFHPDFPADPRVYVNYTSSDSPNGQLATFIDELELDAGDPEQVDLDTRRSVLILNQPDTNHNGGMIAFGPDRYLYIGMGDGGGSNDSAGQSSRDFDVLHSKMLRIGVEPDGSDDMPSACESCSTYGPFDYTIPDDNPFVGMNEYAPEIFALGFRNPWRFSFDLDNGDLYAGDVGQDCWEEIDFVQAGEDYGWNDLEGFHDRGDCSDDEPHDPHGTSPGGGRWPIAEFDNDGTAVVGGAVYRSCEVPEWQGTYLYANYTEGTVWALRFDSTGLVSEPTIVASVENEFIYGFGQNAWGDVYFTTVITDFSGEPVDGKVYRIAPG